MRDFVRNGIHHHTASDPAGSTAASDAASTSPVVVAADAAEDDDDAAEHRSLPTPPAPLLLRCTPSPPLAKRDGLVGQQCRRSSQWGALPPVRVRSLGVEPAMTRRPGAEGAARGGPQQKAEEQPKAAKYNMDPTHILLRGRSHR